MFLGLWFWSKAMFIYFCFITVRLYAGCIDAVDRALINTVVVILEANNNSMNNNVTDIALTVGVDVPGL